MDNTYYVSEIFSYAEFMTAVYILAPILTFLVGAVIGLMFYYKFGEKYGVKTPVIWTKTGKLHLPMFLAVVLYVLFFIIELWYIYYGTGKTYTLTVTGYDCFYHCHLNPLFYFWAAAMIAAVALTVLAYKKKVNFAITYLVIGISFIIFYWFTSYGAELYAVNYLNNIVMQSEFTGLNNNASPMCIVTGILYIVCAVVLLALTAKKKVVDKQSNNQTL